MHKSATKCNETVGKWGKNKHGASKIIDTLETYHSLAKIDLFYYEDLEVILRPLKTSCWQFPPWMLIRKLQTAKTP
jgi:hypothetical protein